ncbi:MAG: HD domain-containing protein, partial [Candidatus Methylomirabilis sp.]|nr:HD domain-containing protein [Deltaproteobacteria bacterium]
MADPTEIPSEVELAGLEPESPDGPPIEARRKLDRPVIDLRESFRALLPPVGTPAEGGELAGLARDYLSKGDEILRQAAERGASGAEVVHNRAWLMDYLIARLYSIADRRASRRFSSIRQESAIAGLGGYGRGELSFGSDVDLMLLYAWKVTPRIEYLWELLFLTLNDARIKVGFSTRTVDECVRIALEDRTARTALIDHRYVAGSRKLYDELEATMRARVSSKGTAPFIRETLAWAEERRAKHGDSIYLLEPNVKEGQGGLRDLHTALWVAKVWFKVRSVGELVMKGVLTPEEAERYASLEEFLWRIRNALHLIADKPTDRLTFDVQEKTARWLGYEDDAERRAVERFMQDYYRTASESLGFSKMLIARCQGPDNASTRILGYFTRRDVGDGFRIYRGELALTDLGSLKDHPERLALAFDLAQKHGVPLAPATAERIAAEAHLLDEAAVRSPAVVKAFERILTWRHAVRPTLLEMHRAGVLERILPELRHLRYLVQHDLYHVYTVDVHSIHCLGEMQALLQGARREELPLLSRAAAGVDDPFVALLGAFFHDIGKGLGGNHSEKGAAMVADVADRLGFPPERKDLLVFLVREHLAMPALAFRRDMNDPYVIHTLAK